MDKIELFKEEKDIIDENCRIIGRLIIDNLNKSSDLENNANLMYFSLAASVMTLIINTNDRTDISKIENQIIKFIDELYSMLNQFKKNEYSVIRIETGELMH